MHLRDRYLELVAVSGAFHQVPTVHAAEGTAELAGTSVREFLARSQYGCLANDTGAIHFMHGGKTVADEPMPVQELHCFASCIGDRYPITEQIPCTKRIALGAFITRFSRYADIVTYRG